MPLHKLNLQIDGKHLSLFTQISCHKIVAQNCTNEAEQIGLSGNILRIFCGGMICQDMAGGLFPILGGCLRGKLQIFVISHLGE